MAANGSGSDRSDEPPDQRRLARFRIALDAEAREVAALRSRLAANERERAAAEHDIAALRTAIAELEQSSSWRLTAPLRRMITWLRAVRAGAPADTRPHYRIKRSPAANAPAQGGDAVIIVSPVVPWPIRAGNEYRIARMVSWLRTSGRNPILIVAPVGADLPDERAFAQLAGECPAFLWVGRDGTVRAGPGIDPRWLLAFEGAPVVPVSGDVQPWRLAETERTYTHSALAGVFAELVRTASASTVIVNYVWFSSLLDLVPADVLRVIDTHDVFSLKAAKVVDQGVPVDDVLTAEEEGALLDRADLILAIHDADRVVLDGIVSHPRVVTVGVDVDVTATAAPRPGKRVLFVASANPLNVRGLRDFIRFAWREVRRAVPDAELRIVGNVGEMLEAPEAGVVVLGSVDDPALEYAAARLVINPVRPGTGLKIKTVEAVGHGCPVVSWPAGIEGLPPALLPLCTVADNWPDFTEAVIDALARPPAAADVAGVREALAPASVYAELEAALGR